MKNIFDLHYQYELYLQRVGLTDQGMHPQQKIETKRAFFGACGQLLVLLRDDVGGLSEDEAIKVMTLMTGQVLDFFLKESNQSA